MKYYLNINKALGIAALVATGAAAIWYLVNENKKAKELEDYKDDKLSAIDTEISEASIANDKLESSEDRAAAMEILYHLKSKVRNASNKSEVDRRYSELVTQMSSFKNDDAVNVKASIIFYRARLLDMKDEERRIKYETFEKEKVGEYAKAVSSVIRTVGCYL